MRRRGGAADRRRGMLHVTGDTLFGRRRRAPVCQIESTLEDTTLEKKFGHGNQPITKQVPGLLKGATSLVRSSQPLGRWPRLARVCAHPPVECAPVACTRAGRIDEKENLTCWHHLQMQHRGAKDDVDGNVGLAASLGCGRKWCVSQVVCVYALPP